MLILLRTDISHAAACKAGLAQFDARAQEQSGVDFGGGVVGNGVDCYYPDGLGDVELLRIAETRASTVLWLITRFKLRPSTETRAEVRRLHKVQLQGKP